MKLFVDEPESAAVRGALALSSQLASALVEVETLRVVRRHAPGSVAAVEAALAGLTLVEITSSIRAAAARLDPATLRSLDAIHLATALSVRDELEALLTYDTRLAEAAAAHGMTVLAPS